MSEIWKNIPNFEGLYQVSDHGRVRSVDRLSYQSNCKKPHKLSGTDMSQYISKHGYMRIGLKKNQYNVHRLVMMAFVGESELLVDHIDENKQNNNLSNLRYCTPRENTLFSTTKENKSKNYKSKYTGVTQENKTGKWISRISIKGERVYLGFYGTELEAHKAYQKSLNEITEEQELESCRKLSGKNKDSQCKHGNGKQLELKF